MEEIPCGNCGMYYRKHPEITECPKCKTQRPQETEDPIGYTGYYGQCWSKKRQEILERDNYTCQGDNCTITNREHKERNDLFPPNGGLHIHHITPAREFDEYNTANKNTNLIPLCANCHRKRE